MNKTVAIEDMIPLMKEQFDQGGQITFTPKGISMLPMLRHNKDTVTLKSPVFPLKKYDIPFYIRNNGSYVLHRIVKVRPDGYVLRGDNQFFNEDGIQENQIIAVMESFTRKGKKYQCTDKMYRLYCVVWTGTVHLRKALRLLRRFGGKIKRKLLRIIK